MLIRSFKIEDVKKLNEVISNCLLEVNSNDYSKKIISNMLTYYSISNIISNSKKKNIFVLEDSKKIIGTISVLENQIYGLYVSPDYLKKGLGSKLMYFAE